MLWWLLAAIGVSWLAVWALFRPCRVPTQQFPAPSPADPSASTDPLQSAPCRFLASACCSIGICGDDVSVLATPPDFFAELLARIAAARHDIVVSALYIGDGPLSQRFVAALETKVRERLQLPADGPLTITVLLDYNRMHHAKNLVTVQSLLELAENISSNSNMILAEVACQLVSVRLFLYDTPSLLSRWLAPFGRAKEVIGVQHTKLFLFDESDALLTGANLSDDYFTTRMDRYFVVRRAPALVFWCRELTLTLCRLSHPVVCQAALRRTSSSSSGGAAASAGPQGGGTPTGRCPTKPRLHRKSCLVILGVTEDGLDPGTDCAAYKHLAQRLLTPFARPDFFATYRRRSDGALFADSQQGASAAAAPPPDTLIFPTLQFARANIFHDSSVVEGVLGIMRPTDRVVVTSPYLNMYSGFVEQVLGTSARFDFITASAQANGWKGQRGFAGYIPLYYTQLERAFFFLMEAYGCQHRVGVYEFTGKDMTYHAKGLWVSTAGDQRPAVTAIGSTNYGSRSVLKDVEAELFFVTRNSGLRDRIALELKALFESSVEAQRQQFLGDRPGRFQPVVSLIAQLGQDFL